MRISLGTTELGVTRIKLTSSELSIHDWERTCGETNRMSGWLSPIEIDEATDLIGPDPEPSGRRASRKGAVAIPLARYLELLDWVGRTVRGDKRGAIPPELAPILSRLGLTAQELLQQVWKFSSPRTISPFPSRNHRWCRFLYRNWSLCKVNRLHRAIEPESKNCLRGFVRTQLSRTEANFARR